eukprot:1263444-Pleurochrysis_carterae.AAC.1
MLPWSVVSVDASHQTLSNCAAIHVCIGMEDLFGYKAASDCAGIFGQTPVRFFRVPGGHAACLLHIGASHLNFSGFNNCGTKR